MVGKREWVGSSEFDRTTSWKYSSRELLRADDVQLSDVIQVIQFIIFISSWRQIQVKTICGSPLLYTRWIQGYPVESARELIVVFFSVGL